MVSFLFVTAPAADIKTINRALLHMREWGTGFDETFDPCKLKIDKAPYTEDASEDDQSPSPPLRDLSDNAWSGASTEDVESYCFDYVQAGAPNDGHLFAILDAAAIESKTCILANLPYEYYDDPSTFRGKYNKVRVPWDEFYLMWCNLDIANMNFEEFTEEGEDGGDDQGWFTYNSVSNGSDISEEGAKKRDAMLERLRLQEYV